VDTERDDLVACAERGMAVAWHAARQPDKAALISPSSMIAYGELNARANRLARAFRRLGLQRGDPVALLCSNRPEFVEVVLATHRTGLRLTTVNWHLTGEEAGYVVDDCEAKAFVAEARFADAAREAAAAAPLAAARLAVGGGIDGFDEYGALRSSRARTCPIRCLAARCSTRRAPRGGPKACTATRRRSRPP
jgi:long-chain acyl-CoA synthetase